MLSPWWDTTLSGTLSIPPMETTRPLNCLQRHKNWPNQVSNYQHYTWFKRKHVEFCPDFLTVFFMILSYYIICSACVAVTKQYMAKKCCKTYIIGSFLYDLHSHPLPLLRCHSGVSCVMESCLLTVPFFLFRLPPFRWRRNIWISNIYSFVEFPLPKLLHSIS